MNTGKLEISSMKSIKRFKILTLILALISVTVSAQITEQSLKFGEVLDKISRFYVDTVNEEKIVNEVINNMLHELDPHSAYLTSEQVKASQEQLEGGFEGIGVAFNILQDTIFIINPIAGGPSERVGIKPGDRIIKIEGENVAGVGISNIDVQKKLKGEKGTRVNVSIKRKGAKKLLDFTITRDEIPIYSLDASYMIDNETGYIRLARFSSTTMQEFNKALFDLKDQGMKNLVLDLSGNGGGYLHVAVQLADHFLDGRRMIVYTEGTNNPRRNYYSSSGGFFHDGQLVVMIDETSASASEIVAGAVQDWDRAVIVGRRSFGKGLVQGRFDLRDGSELRLTVAKYYTPSGRLIQKPYDEGFDAYSRDILDRFSSGELSDRDKIELPDSLKYKTLVKNRVVYGGGGIMPDYFVPLDTTEYSEYYREIMSQGILNQFIIQYVDINRRNLQASYTDFEVFRENFNTDDEFMNELIAYAEEEGVEYVEEDLNISKNLLSVLAKAYIARDLWDTSEFYRIYNGNDPIFRKAFEIAKSTNLYQAKLEAYTGDE